MPRKCLIKKLQYNKEYNQRPEVKERRREYNQRPEIKEDSEFEIKVDMVIKALGFDPEPLP